MVQEFHAISDRSRLHYKNYFTIKSTANINLASMNVIKANTGLCKVLGGKPENISELKDSFLLVEVANTKQSAAIVCLNK